jgi:hypothetical protein
MKQLFFLFVLLCHEVRCRASIREEETIFEVLWRGHPRQDLKRIEIIYKKALLFNLMGYMQFTKCLPCQGFTANAIDYLNQILNTDEERELLILLIAFQNPHSPFAKNLSALFGNELNRLVEDAQEKIKKFLPSKDSEEDLIATQTFLANLSNALSNLSTSVETLSR